MKTIRSLYNFLMFFPVAGFFFAGCYTHMETMRDEGSGGRDGDDYAYIDSTNASNDTTGANYFSDDDYRESRYRASFDYYAPPAYIWGSNICYDPWYDDCWYPTLGTCTGMDMTLIGEWVMAIGGTATGMVDMAIAEGTEGITLRAEHGRLAVRAAVPDSLELEV